MNCKTVFICGSNHWNYYDDSNIIKFIKSLPENVTIIYGPNKGVTHIINKYAKKNNLKTIQFKLDFQKHGKNAYFERNKEMIEKGKPDLIVIIESYKYKYSIDYSIIELATQNNIRMLQLNFDGSSYVS
jgi:hypothetical protein